MKEPVNIGSRIEMFVDDWLIEEKRGVGLKLHSPERKEIVLEFTEPWEGKHCGYFSVIQEEQKIRMYYRGNSRRDDSPEQVTCYAESEDGIRFVKPELGLHEFDGSKRNNIMLKGVLSHNFSPFRDSSPSAAETGAYKAVTGTSVQAILNKAPLYALRSDDGIHWSMIQDEPIMTDGAFDSQNVAFWDGNIGAYRCYNRCFSAGEVRAVQSASSPDFVRWSPQQLNVYANEAPLEQFYTNSTILCPGAEHMYVSFPMRFVPERKKIAKHPEMGVSDAVLMTSRDGTTWDRTFMEAWVRPGTDEGNWTDRNLVTAYGCVESDTEFYFYLGEHYRRPSIRLRRYAIRKHGFASVHAGYTGGEFTTRPVLFTGSRLMLNYSTSAVGSIQVELLDEAGRTIDGFAFEDMEPLYGDELAGAVQWKAGADLSGLEGKPVRFRFRMKDADLYALQVI